MGKHEIIEVLKELWPKNKAKGLLAQAIFMKEIKEGRFGRAASEKVVEGCWLAAPRDAEFYKFRFSFFVHPEMLAQTRSNRIKTPMGAVGDSKAFYRIARFLTDSGIAVNYAITSTESGRLPLTRLKKKQFTDINWKLLSSESGVFVQRKSDQFFTAWSKRGHRGPVSRWDRVVRRRMNQLNLEELTRLLLHELFYAGFIKSVMHVSTSDPYDVDGFLVNNSSKAVFPLEIKEKSPRLGNEPYFGIDAGRVMMLLRLCILSGSNAIFLVREMTAAGNFRAWKYMTLSDIIMKAGWNLQPGGTGMGGQGTQVIRLPYAEFKVFDKRALSDKNLSSIGSLQSEIRDMTLQFGKELSLKYHRKSA